MSYGTIFLVSIFGIVILLVFIYQSKYEKLKFFTTIVIIGLFSWALPRERPNGEIIGIFVFLIVSGFVIYVHEKVNKEELRKRSLRSSKQFYDFLESQKAYKIYLELHSVICDEELRNSNVLPFDKDKFIMDTILYIECLEKKEQDYLLFIVPQLAFYQESIREEGYISNASKGLDIKDDFFPYELYNKCKIESDNLFYNLKFLIAPANSKHHYGE